MISDYGKSLLEILDRSAVLYHNFVAHVRWIYIHCYGS